MPARKHAERAQRRAKQEEPATQLGAASDQQVLKDGMDEVLDEIDSLLEENAQAFVDSYVQRGGE